MLSNTATVTVTNLPPVITAHPQSQTAKLAAPVTLSVSAGGAGLTYQWQLNGANIPGATSATLTLPSVAPGAAGDYTVVVRNAAGSVTSSVATLGMVPGRVVNLSILTSIAPGDPLTVGTVVGGKGASGGMPLLIRGMGPSLAPLGVSGANPDPRLEVFSGSAVIASNDNWGGTTTLSAVASEVGAFPFVDGASRDAAVVFGPTIAAPPTGYTVQVTGAGSASGSVIAELYDAVPRASIGATTPRLINVSVLKQLPANGLLTAGFVIGPGTPKQVLLRAVGPALGAAPFNVSGAMPNPRITLFGAGGTTIATNDDWGGDSTLAAAFAAAGAFALPAASRDAALLVTLEPGSYTAQVAASIATAAATGGVALVEVYDMDGGSAPAIHAPLASLRATTGANVMLSVGATGAIGYQWQRLPAGASSWVNLSDGGGFTGTAGAMLLAGGGAAQNGDQFRVAVSNSAGVVRSNPVTVTLTAPPTAISVANSVASPLAPLSVITVNAAGLVPDAVTYVEFMNSANMVIAQVPPVTIAAGSLTVAIPPIPGGDGTSLVGGTLSARIVQLLAGTAVVSNTFAAAQVQAAPASKAQPGALALALLQAELDEARTLLGQLSGTPYDNAATRDVVNSTIQSVQGWINLVQRTMNEGSVAFTALSETAVTLRQSDLQFIDNFLIASLQALGGGTAAAARSDSDGRMRAAAGAPTEAQSAANTFARAAIDGAAISVLAPLARNYVSTLRHAVGPEGAVLLGTGSVVLGSFGVGVALSAGAPFLAGAGFTAAGLGLLGIALPAEWLMQAPTAQRAGGNVFKPANDARAAWTRLLSSLGAAGVAAPRYSTKDLVALLEGPTVRGLIDAFPDPTDLRGGFLRVAADRRHGSRGVVLAAPSGHQYGLAADPVPFAAPALESPDADRTFTREAPAYYHFAGAFTLRPVPLDNSVFTGWQVRSPVFSSAGYVQAGRDPPDLTLQMTQGGLFVIASFDVTHLLTLTAGSNGTVAPPAPAPARYLSGRGLTAPSYVRGDKVRITAQPNAGFVFSSWSGDYTGTSNPATIEITRDLRVTANFNAAATPPPSAPANLAATAGNQQVSLTWTAVTGAASYRVKRSTTSGGSYTTIASPATTSYADTGLINGTTYYYVVTAVNSSGESGNSNQASATPLAGGGGTIDLRSSAFVGYFVITYTGTRTRPGRSPEPQSGSYWVRHDGDGVIQRVDRIGTLRNTGDVTWEFLTPGFSSVDTKGIIWTGRLSVVGQNTRASGSGTYDGTSTIGNRHTGTWTARWSPNGD